MIRHLFMCAALVGAMQAAHAQNQDGIDQGLQYMQGVKPTTKGQIVNPAAVNSKAWTSTAIPTTVPQGMGALSNPNTSQATLGQARAVGLSGWGMATQQQCATYQVGSGDAYLDQQCAAVNFLSNSCMTLSNSQKQVVGNINNVTAGTTNCTGTYGAGAANFNFANTINGSDSIFTNINNARDTAKMIMGGDQACSEQTVVTKPAEKELYTCIQSTQTDAFSCSQNLNTVIVTTAQTPTETQTCSQGVQVGNYCQASETGDAVVKYACPAGYELQGSNCVGSETIPATIVSYTCSAGLTLQPDNTCGQTSEYLVDADVNASCPNGAQLVGYQCVTQTTVPGIPVWGCQPGYTQVGNNCVKTTSTDAIQGSCQKLVDYWAANHLWGWVRDNGINCDGSGQNCQAECDVLTDKPSCPAIAGYTELRTDVDQQGSLTCTMVSLPSCPSGTLQGNQCIMTDTTVTTITNYSCTSGTVDGSNCVTKTTTSAAVTYSCPGDSKPIDGLDDQCLETTTVYEPATPHYSCPAGDTLEGTNCVGPINQAASVTYSCPDGAQLQGTQCVTTVTVPVTKVYSCIDGSAPVDGVCQIKSVQTNWTDTCGVYESSSGSMLPPPK